MLKRKKKSKYVIIFEKTVKFQQNWITLPKSWIIARRGNCCDASNAMQVLHISVKTQSLWNRKFAQNLYMIFIILHRTSNFFDSYESPKVVFYSQSGNVFREKLIISTELLDRMKQSSITDFFRNSNYSILILIFL